MNPKPMRHLLPSYFPLKEYRFDIQRIAAEVRQIESKFGNVLQSNKELCSNNHALVESVYSHYEQISLTVCPSSKSEVSFSDCAALGESAGLDSESTALSRHARHRLKSSVRTDRPELDERNYCEPTDLYKNTYIQKCVESFGEKQMRVRLVKLKAGKLVDWHTDYDPTYATRIIIAVDTNPQVVNATRRKGVEERVHIPADGTPWFLNTGFPHMVFNGGTTDRIILMFSLSSDRLLQKISQQWSSRAIPSEKFAHV